MMKLITATAFAALTMMCATFAYHAHGDAIDKLLSNHGLFQETIVETTETTLL